MKIFKRGLAIVLAFLMTVAFIPQNYAEAVSDEWEQLSPFPTANTINDVTYGNHQFVAVGRNQVILTSADGKNWMVSDHPEAINSNLSSVSYGNGRFVAVGSSGLVVTLVDGETEWKNQKQNITTYGITSVVYGNGKFVAVGADGKVMTSTDGVTWTGQTVGSTSNFHMDVTYGKDKFVGVGIRGFVIQSADGISWSTKTVSTTNMFYGVTYGNNKYVAVGQSGLIMTSTDGINWNNMTSNTSATLNKVIYDNISNLYVAVGGGGTIVTSLDGTTWTVQIKETAKDLNGIGTGDGLIVVVGYSGVILTSDNGISWTDQLKGTAAGLEGLVYGNGMFVAVGNELVGSTTSQSLILTSPDGKAWINRKPSVAPFTRDYIGSVSYGNGKFIALGYKESAEFQGLIMTSSNGISWTEQTYGEGTLLGSVYGDQQYVIVGANGTILTSSNGETWTSQANESSDVLYGVSYGNGLYVAVGGSTVLTSSDGITWKQQPTDSSTYLYNVTYGNGLFVAVGEGGKIITSSDGLTWTGQTSPVYSALHGIHYDENGFKAAGASGTIVTSTDGITWTKQPSGTNIYLMDIVSSGSEDVVIGQDGVILRKTVTNNTINPTTGFFDKYSSSPDYKDVTTEVILNGNELTGITNGVEALVLGTDYNVVAGTVTISKEYLSKQAEGTLNLIFTFSKGAPQKLEVTISDTTPQMLTVSYLPGDHGAFEGTSENVATGGHPAAVPTVTPAEGYHFAGWSIDGGITKLTSQQVTAVTVTADVTFTAYYKVFVMGDADGDGKVTAADALLLSKYIKGKITLTPEQLQALDMNGDGKWDDEDIKVILAISVGKG
jgi:photosystem II stability/assembly factor-like uncharacterized protein